MAHVWLCLMARVWLPSEDVVVVVVLDVKNFVMYHLEIDGELTLLFSCTHF